MWGWMQLVCVLCLRVSYVSVGVLNECLVWMAAFEAAVFRARDARHVNTAQCFSHT